ncbi:hypothetical protein B0H15DRAFT_823613 [Mycena belliarum]|uniref:TEA domain-containing protein n=1 Tax=Mycena belliarum TaxID=1033014 RepID=A0AAD6UDW5_9AGAR|nr:hypothetical protein B0H15DRAFT_823613 [Mycena belliae]
MDPDPPMPAPSASASLTPQRKHRKLLKDGSGTAVWPEAVEAVFVQGLREYWDSPWATYSRGRSRWRNQFLVDYLNNLGIVRTKKQVASHIQVLRNMWKGEPEYHLVAGGEELFPDPVKVEEHPHLLTLDHDDDDVSELSNSPPHFFSDFPPSPGESSPMFPGLTYSPSSPLSSVPEIESPPNAFSTLATPYPYAPYQKPYLPAPAPVVPVRYANRCTTLSLLAEGMTAFTVNLDKLSPPAALPARTPPLVLRLRLAVPPVDDARAPANLHGFFASVRLASVWSAQAKVLTRVYDAAGQCISSEADALQPSSVELGSVVASLPESSLSRARWFDSNMQTSLTQQLVVDGSTLLLIVYELDRRTGHSALPSAELISFQKYISTSDPKPLAYAYNYPYAAPPASASTYSPPAAAPTYSPQSNGYYAPATYAPSQRPPPTSSYTPSLSSALTPVPLRP